MIQFNHRIMKCDIHSLLWMIWKLNYYQTRRKCYFCIEGLYFVINMGMTGVSIIMTSLVAKVYYSKKRHPPSNWIKVSEKQSFPGEDIPASWFRMCVCVCIYINRHFLCTMIYLFIYYTLFLQNVKWWNISWWNSKQNKIYDFLRRVISITQHDRISELVLKCYLHAKVNEWSKTLLWKALLLCAWEILIYPCMSLSWLDTYDIMKFLSEIPVSHGKTLLHYSSQHRWWLWYKHSQLRQLQELTQDTGQWR